MPKFDVVSAIEGRKRQLLVEELRKRHELTIGELNQLARGELGPLLRSITIAELMGSAPVSSVSGAARRPAASGQPETRVPRRKPVDSPSSQNKPLRSEVVTRTAAGREAFDEQILAAIKAIGGPASATELQHRVGGTNMQIRSGVNRLIEAGHVTWTGKARGTRYYPA
ncbi:hypothetical protein OV203_05945 [Nannocystis sp. ILAH1]|uniref:hypothetical protein n=1 Tax=unclassified Nannocystis TaxID=2627009 RepID=UPI002270AD6A|nr:MULTISPECIES: hypothetical protein [unclassified Nannocystis]MCY0986652.1 hypothetical protein [Nannocystis sp. ILAH1]MCY1071532.1 hypothetical protein [Nannocystis sp. RBIL2]